MGNMPNDDSRYMTVVPIKADQCAVISQIQDGDNNDTISILLQQVPSVVLKEEFHSLGLE